MSLVCLPALAVAGSLLTTSTRWGCRCMCLSTMLGSTSRCAAAVLWACTCAQHTSVGLWQAVPQHTPLPARQPALCVSCCAPQEHKIVDGGFERTIASNFFGGFWLTQLLLEDLEANAPARYPRVHGLTLCALHVRIM